MKVGFTRTIAGASLVALSWLTVSTYGAEIPTAPQVAVSRSQSVQQTAPRSTFELFPVHPQQGGQAMSPVDPNLAAEKVFKNIQALKGISAGDFMGTMGIMTAALGFDCSECHNDAGTDKVDWAHDTPRKVIARRMVNMVTEINKTHFGGRQMITCWSCHRGRDKPVVTPRLDIVYGEPTIEPDDLVPLSVPGLKKPDEIIDRYLNAIGGMQRLSTISSISATGTAEYFRGFGGKARLQFYAKAPDQRTQITEFPEDPGRDANIRSFDGKAGWIKIPLTVLGEYQLSGAELAGAKLDAQLTFPAQIKKVLTNFRTLEPATVDDKLCDVVQGSGPERLFVTLYFDSATGLLVRSIRYAPSPIGRMPTQIDYSDYREVNGVKLAHKQIFAFLDGRDTMNFVDVKLNQPLDASKFGRPTVLEKKP